MNPSSTTPEVPVPPSGWQPPENLTPGERRFVLMFAGVWLVFLAWPIFETVTAPGPSTAARVLALAAIIAFGVIYLASFVRSRPIQGLSLAANTAVQTAVLTALIAAAIPAAGATVAGMVPYLMALWMFTHRLVVGVPMALVMAIAGSLGVVVIAGAEFRFALITPIIFTAGIITLFRLADEHSEVERQLSERVALSEQREELARTVHDALGHSLTSITVQAQLARRLVGDDPAAAERQLDGILATARDSLRDVRSTVEFLDAPGLADQLDLARATLAAAGIEADVPAAADLPALEPGHRRLFSWCLREAVTNVVRHSGASRCRIEILGATDPATSAGGAVLRVIDDGAGIPGGMGGAAVAAGTGLRGLARRAERASARLTITDAASDSGDDHHRPGTILEVRA
ncbi:sensor histidine kinase [Corynebacterium sp. NPDC060344]|uniref:sensor histidine kinase n=1 Tax=Corynebacterium sp. NPDC060344 TaxID=3347101 RepID=UPI003653DE1E